MKKFIACVLIGLGVHVTMAQPVAPLNQLIRKSFTYFPKLRELEKASELGALQVDLAKSGYLPAVSGVASYAYLNPISQKAFPSGPNETQVLKFQPNNNYNLNLGITQTLWDFGKTEAQVEKAKSDLLTSRQNIEVAQQQLASQVGGIYFSMIYLKRASGVADSVMNFYEANKKIVQGRIRQGDALQIDLTTIQNNIDQEKSKKVELMRLYERQAALLRYTTGETDAIGANQLAFDFTSPHDLANNAELKSAEQRIATSSWDVKLARRNQLPTIAMQAGAGFRNGFQPDINAFRFNYIGGVSVAVPIFQGNRLNKTIRLASQALELSQLSKSTLSAAVQKDVESTQADLKAYEEQIRNADGQIQLSNETRKLTEVRYRQGVVTYLELINASTNLQRALLNKLQFELQLVLARLEMCRLTGVKYWER